MCSANMLIFKSHIECIKTSCDRGYISFPNGLFKDIAWFIDFFYKFNGVAAMQ